MDRVAELNERSMRRATAAFLGREKVGEQIARLKDIADSDISRALSALNVKQDELASIMKQLEAARAERAMLETDMDASHVRRVAGLRQQIATVKQSQASAEDRLRAQVLTG